MDRDNLKAKFGPDIIEAIDRDCFALFLDHFCDAKESFQTAKTAEDKRRHAWDAFVDLANVFALLAGEEVLQAALGEIPNDPSGRAIRVGAFLQFLVAPIKDRDLNIATEDIVLMARGDAPLVIHQGRGKQGHPTHAVRIARTQLKAWQWNAYLLKHDNKPGEVHAEISGAFGTSWENIRRWTIRDKLGDRYVDQALKLAEQWWRHNSTEEALKQLQADGAEYKRVKGYSVTDTT